jgi:hypothetical protein
VQPSDVKEDKPITPPVVVALRDNQGNIVTSFTGEVTMALGPGGGSGKLGGTLKVRAVAGVATFGKLKISRKGTGYTLIATAKGYQAVTSAPFDVK